MEQRNSLMDWNLCAVMAAERQLEESAAHLDQIRVEALLGIHYHPDQLDDAIVRYRAALRAAETARRRVSRLLIAAFTPAHRPVQGAPQREHSPPANVHAMCPSLPAAA
jgi:hypothetical protein